MNELETIPTTELMAEVSKRFDTLIMVGIPYQDGTMSDFFCSGNRFTCLGLLGAASRIILQEIKAQSVELNNLNIPLDEREIDGNGTR